MQHYNQDQIQAAKQVDLLTYLQTRAPSELVRVSGDTYCTREHDSLKISNGMWNWFSRGFGGRTALDYLMKVKGLSFSQALEAILGESGLSPPVTYKQAEHTPKRLLLPERNNNADQVISYLRGRGIHPDIIRYCLEHVTLYESTAYHNAVFVGYDERGKPRHAAIRSTTGRYKGDAAGSDKRYSFSIEEDSNSEHLHLFESAIDLMSYATIQHMRGRDWKQDALLSLAGVFQTKRQNVLPVALKRYLNLHPEVRTIHLHLDNDEVGRGAAEGIIKRLENLYEVLDEPPDRGKDMNDFLLLRLGRKKTKEEHER